MRETSISQIILNLFISYMHENKEAILLFRTIIPLKKIATQKVGGGNVPHDVPHSVPHDVPHDVPQGRDELIEFIKAQVRLNNKITRQAIAEGVGVSVKTIQRTLKEIDNLKYVGSGNSGHWELNE